VLHLDLALLQRVAWIAAITLVTVAVFLQNVIGIDWSTILVVPGIITMTAYFTSKGFTRQRPKYVAAKARLLTAIWIMAVGGVVVVLSEIPAVLPPSNSANITLKAVGSIVMIGGITWFIFSLMRANPNKPIAC
jgi:hypothetical protein